MLNTIKRGNVDGYTNGQEDICHLVSDVQKIDEAEIRYIFTNGHAIMQPIEFFDSIGHLNKVDWEIFYEEPLIPSPDGYAKYWQNKQNPSKPKWMDRTRLRQAEFLIYKKLEWQFITGIGVINDEKASIVRNLFEKYNIQIKVIVRPEYYFLENQ